jgi:hypothetical protein
MFYTHNKIYGYISREWQILMKKNEKLTEQYLLRMTPELMGLIDAAFSKYLKETGKYITKAEFIRNILQDQCCLMIGVSDI